MVGAGESFHLEPLAQCIKKSAPQYWLQAHGIFNIQKDGTRTFPNSSNIFDAVSQFPKQHPITPSYKVTDKRSVTKKLRPFLIWGLSIFYRLLRGWLQALHHRSYFNHLLLNIDLVHLQSLFIGPAHYWLLSRPQIPFVISCWGSDVLRNADCTNHLIQKSLLENASAITVTGLEFKEIVLAKFGRHLEPKIINTYFNPGIEKIRTYANHHQFKIKPSCPKQIWRICLGHNGFKEGNHSLLIQEIATLPDNVKSKIELLIPMTYGAHSDYIEEIRYQAAQSGCQFKLFEDYMTDEEVYELRLITDILIFAPVSDAFSATVTQAFAAKTVVIVGTWLPYKTRLTTGFNYHEIRTYHEAGSCIMSILDHWDSEQLVLEENCKLADKLFSEKAIGSGWIKAYHLALTEFNKKNRAIH